MCSKCRSTRVKIRLATGIERFVILFTQTRKYICLDCDHAFRAPDRRLNAREDEAYLARRASENLRW